MNKYLVRGVVAGACVVAVVAIIVVATRPSAETTVSPLISAVSAIPDSVSSPAGGGFGTFVSDPSLSAGESSAVSSVGEEESSMASASSGSSASAGSSSSASSGGSSGSSKSSAAQVSVVSAPSAASAGSTDIPASMQVTVAYGESTQGGGTVPTDILSRSFPPKQAVSLVHAAVQKQFGSDVYQLYTSVNVTYVPENGTSPAFWDITFAPTSSETTQYYYAFVDATDGVLYNVTSSKSDANGSLTVQKAVITQVPGSTQKPGLYDGNGNPLS